MNYLKRPASLLLALLFLVTTATSVRAQNDVGFDRDLLKMQDELMLKSGASLSGVIGILPDDKTEPVPFESSDGQEMLIDRSLIYKIEKVDSAAQRYNDALSQMEDDAQSHRDMITWCEEQERGRIRFKSQILFHRKRILHFEPNDRPTRSKLGYTFLRDENRWVDEEQFWSQQGYNSRGDSTLYDKTVGQVEAIEDQLKVKRRKFGNWQSNLRRMSHSEAVDSLVELADPQLMPQIYKAYSETKDVKLRAVYAEVFATARPTTTFAIRGLVTAVMDDRSDIAMDYLQQDDFNQSQIAAEFKKFLGSKNNRQINRAGYALGELGAPNAILSLSKALVTNHQTAAGSNQSGATRTQGSAGGESFSFGNKKPQFRDFRNDAVLGALRKITGQDFGFSEEAYQQWYVQNYTHVGLKARR